MAAGTAASFELVFTLIYYFDFAHVLWFAFAKVHTHP